MLNTVLISKIGSFFLKFGKLFNVFYSFYYNLCNQLKTIKIAKSSGTRSKTSPITKANCSAQVGLQNATKQSRVIKMYSMQPR